MNQVEKKYEKKRLNKMKVTFLLIASILLFFATLTGLLLNKHLFEIQNIERLARFNDYEEFRLDLHPTMDCKENQDQLIYEDGKTKIYLTCLFEANIYYGSTKTTLQNAFEKGYINMKYLTENTTKERTETYNKYTYKDAENKTAQYVVYEFFKKDEKTEIYIQSFQEEATKEES